jgi:hypothetical protein
MGAAENSWRLVSIVPVSIDDKGLLNDSALQQLLTLQSFAQQYRAQGLEVEVRLTSTDSRFLKSDFFHNAVTDLNLHDMKVAIGSDESRQQTSLISSPDKVVQHWDGFTGPVVLGLALRQAMGEPAYAQMGMRNHE